MNWEKLYEGIMRTLKHDHPHPCKVAVHDEAQLHLGESAARQLAAEHGKEINLKMIPPESHGEIHVGTHLCEK